MATIEILWLQDYHGSYKDTRVTMTTMEILDAHSSYEDTGLPFIETKLQTRLQFFQDLPTSSKLIFIEFLALLRVSRKLFFLEVEKVLEKFEIQNKNLILL